MSDDTFEVGDVVQLKSGGPKMTVTKVRTDNGKCHCTWFVGDKQDFGVFEPAALKKFKDGGFG